MEYQQVIVDNREEHQEHARYGKMIVLCFNNGNPSCMLGPHYFVLIPAFLLIGTLLIVMYLKIYSLIEFHWKIILGLAIALFLNAYILIGLSNPGIVLKQLQEDSVTANNHRNDPYFCHICCILRERGTKHCEFCDICIKGYDHHCPWIGKCVGAQNKGSFYLFILMTFATLLLFFLATLSSKNNQSNLIHWKKIQYKKLGDPVFQNIISIQSFYVIGFICIIASMMSVFMFVRLFLHFYQLAAQNFIILNFSWQFFESSQMVNGLSRDLSKHNVSQVEEGGWCKCNQKSTVVGILFAHTTEQPCTIVRKLKRLVSESRTKNRTVSLTKMAQLHIISGDEVMKMISNK